MATPTTFSASTTSARLAFRVSPEEEDSPLRHRKHGAHVLRSVFRYIFDADYKYGGLAQVEIRNIDGPIDLFGATFVPLVVNHGDYPIEAYRFGSAAYLTDFSSIPEETLAQLEGLDILFLDALRHHPHPTHSTLEKSLQIVDRLKPKRPFSLTCRTTCRTPRPMLRCRRTCASPTTGSSSNSRFRTPLTMQVFRHLEEVPDNYGPTVVSVGNFDGVHIAHQAVVRHMAERAHAIGGKAVAVTFDPHPLRILRPDSAPKLLSPLEVKLQLLEQTNVDAVLVLPFTRDLSLMPAREFAQRVLVDTLHAREVHEGYNFHFGHKAEGNVETLTAFGREMGFDVHTYSGILLAAIMYRAARFAA